MPKGTTKLDPPEAKGENEKPESYVDKLKRHPVVATVILVGVILVTIPKIIDSIERINEAGEELDPCNDLNIDNRPVDCLWRD